MIRAVALFLAALLLLSVAPATAEPRLHALIVGINAYTRASPLEGAVNDARAIAKSVEPLSDNIRVLLDQNATLDNFLFEWESMLAATQPGDTILLTYAGHGGQEPERVPNSERDQKDEALLFVNYDPALLVPSLRTDLLLDDEIQAMFSEARDRGVRIVFVVDACNSGTMTRGFSTPNGAVRTRMQPSYNFEEDMRLVGSPEPVTGSDASPMAGPIVEGEPLDNVTYISAGVDGQQVPEFPIDGQSHGALSWSFARALGSGVPGTDANRISRGALARYILTSVRGFAEAKQDPTIHPTDGDHEVLFSLPQSTSPGVIEVPPLRLAIAGISEQERTRLFAGLADATLIETGKATLIWHPAEQEVMSSHGDLVAPDIDETRIQGVIDKYRALRLLRELSVRSPIDVSVSPDNDVHTEGDEITYEATGLKYPFMVLFGLAPDGTLQYHFPLASEDGRVDPSAGLKLRFAAGKPYGADHLVALTAPELPVKLISALRNNKNKQAGAWLTRELQALLANVEHQIDAHALFTAPRN